MFFLCLPRDTCLPRGTSPSKTVITFLTLLGFTAVFCWQFLHDSVLEFTPACNIFCLEIIRAIITRYYISDKIFWRFKRLKCICFYVFKRWIVAQDYWLRYDLSGFPICFPWCSSDILLEQKHCSFVLKVQCYNSIKN